MMFRPLLRSFLGKTLVVALLIAASASARDSARVIKLVGSGKATTASGKTLQRSMEIAPGETITTEGVEVFLETAEGAVATIKPGSTVTVKSLGANSVGENTELDLEKGSIISTIDPSKKGKIDYKVRTQRGVAAARATVYSVTVTNTSTSVATLSGTVVLTPPPGSGLKTITINLGSGAVVTASGGAAVPLSQIATQNPQIADAIREAVKTVAEAVQTNSVSGLSSDSATTVLSTVVNAASQALPQEAATFTQQAVNAATSPTSAVGAAGANAVTTISEAAAKGATETLTQQGNTGAAQQVNQQIAQTASSTASSNNVTVSNQAIVNSVQAGASSGASSAGGAAPAPPSLPGTTAPGPNLTTSPATPTTTPPINTDARPTSPAN